LNHSFPTNLTSVTTCLGVEILLDRIITSSLSLSLSHTHTHIQTISRSLSPSLFLNLSLSIFSFSVVSLIPSQLTLSFSHSKSLPFVSVSLSLLSIFFTHTPFLFCSICLISIFSIQSKEPWPMEHAWLGISLCLHRDHGSISSTFYVQLLHTQIPKA